MYISVITMALTAEIIVLLHTGFFRPIHEKKDSFLRAVTNQTANGINENNRT